MPPLESRLPVKIGHIPTNATPGQINTLARYWRRLEEHGLHKVRFHSGEVETVDSFIDVVLDPKSVFFIVYDDETGAIYGECTLNNFMGKTAHVHFSTLPEFYRSVVQIGHETLNQIFELKGTDDTPWISALIGVTPETNRLAVKFIQKMKFKHVLTIPDMCKVGDILVPGFITVRQREV